MYENKKLPVAINLAKKVTLIRHKGLTFPSVRTSHGKLLLYHVQLGFKTISVLQRCTLTMILEKKILYMDEIKV